MKQIIKEEVIGIPIAIIMVILSIYYSNDYLIFSKNKRKRTI